MQPPASLRPTVSILILLIFASCANASDGEWTDCTGGASGLCIDTAAYTCGTATLSGKCAGGTSIRCCPSTSGFSPTTGGGACAAENDKAMCKRTADCGSMSSIIKGKCSGPASVTCCVPPSTPADCKTCVSGGGGQACKSRCQGCASECITCIEGGGGTGCASRCCDSSSSPPSPPPSGTGGTATKPTTAGTFIAPKPDTSGSTGACTTPFQRYTGSCIDVAKCTGGTYKGLCSGSSAVLCCVAETRATDKQALPAMSLATFQTLFEGISATRAAALYPYFLTALVDGNIDTCHEIAAFVAQIGHESAGLRYFEELASGDAYNGRADLGNTQPGDGPRFKGRGPIQLTGRANYRAAGKALGMDLEEKPEQVCLPSAGFKSSVWFWTSNGLNKYCTGTYNDFVTLTRRINGGTNGLDDRLARWDKAKAKLGDCSAGGLGLQATTAVPPPTTPQVASSAAGRHVTAAALGAAAAATTAAALLFASVQ